MSEDARKIAQMEAKIGELEDVLFHKHDNVASFVFNWLTSTHGSDSAQDMEARRVVLALFSDLYAKWDDL